jgi:hypothetical protein
LGVSRVSYAFGPRAGYYVAAELPGHTMSAEDEAEQMSLARAKLLRATPRMREEP